MNASKPKVRTAKGGAPLWPGLTAMAIATLYLIALLAAEQQTSIIFLLIFAIVAVAAAAWFRLLAGVSRSFGDHKRSTTDHAHWRDRARRSCAWRICSASGLIRLVGISGREHAHISGQDAEKCRRFPPYVCG